MASSEMREWFFGRVPTEGDVARAVGSWRVVVRYPCNVAISVPLGHAMSGSIRCPVHRTAHPGSIVVRHERTEAAGG